MKNNNRQNSFFNFIRSFILILLLLPITISGFAQASDFTLKSIDNEFTMEVSRNDYKVMITLYFSKASQFAYVSIERSLDVKYGFRQCRYVQLGDSVNDSIIVVQRDKYAIPASEDAFYRLKTITKDGIIRTYPPVRLPGLGRKKES